MVHRSWLLILCLSCCLARVAGAATVTPARAAARVLAAATCSPLFGDRADRAANRAHRQSMIHFVTEGKGGIVVAHASDSWKQPTRLLATGVRVVETDARAGEALVAVDPKLAARVGCKAGLYRVAVDNAIGRARILGVLRRGLLLEWRSKLRCMTIADEHLPQWMMVWGSRYELHLARGPAETVPSIAIIRGR